MGQLVESIVTVIEQSIGDDNQKVGRKQFFYNFAAGILVCDSHRRTFLYSFRNGCAKCSSKKLQEKTTARVKRDQVDDKSTRVARSVVDQSACVSTTQSVVLLCKGATVVNSPQQRLKLHA